MVITCAHQDPIQQCLDSTHFCTFIRYFLLNVDYLMLKCTLSTKVRLKIETFLSIESPKNRKFGSTVQRAAQRLSGRKGEKIVILYASLCTKEVCRKLVNHVALYRSTKVSFLQ